MPTDSWTRYSAALQRILGRQELRSRLEQDVDGELAGELDITPDMLTDLKRVLLRLPYRSAQENGEQADHFDARDAAIKERALSAEEFFSTTFEHLRRAALVSTVMSIVIFIMGLVLLGIAAGQSIAGDAQSSAIALAASGIVAIAAAFYRSPVHQTRVSAVQMQRSSMILMTYMLGLSLVSKSLSGRSTSEEAEQLSTLTSKLVALLHADEMDEPS